MPPMTVIAFPIVSPTNGAMYFTTSQNLLNSSMFSEIVPLILSKTPFTDSKIGKKKDFKVLATLLRVSDNPPDFAENASVTL